MIKLTPTKRRILERVARQSGRVLKLSVTASGGNIEKSLNDLIRANYIVMVPHPTVIDRFWERPATALAITDEGRNALRAT